jgi:hypothetical protein
MPRELPLMPILDVANDPPQISLDGQSVLLSLVGAGGVRRDLPYPGQLRHEPQRLQSRA